MLLEHSRSTQAATASSVSVVTRQLGRPYARQGGAGFVWANFRPLSSCRSPQAALLKTSYRSDGETRDGPLALRVHAAQTEGTAHRPRPMRMTPMSRNTPTFASSAVYTSTEMMNWAV